MIKTAAALLLACAAQVCAAHDIPGKATVLLYLKPQDNRLLVLARLPMEALTEAQFPTRGPGFLDIGAADAALVDAARIYLVGSLQVFADGAALPPGEIVKARVAQPGDRSFVDFESAMRLVDGPRLPDEEELYWKQAMLDVLLSFPIASSRAEFAVDPKLDRIAMATHTVMRFVTAAGDVRAYDFTGYPGRVELEPGWWRAAWRFTQLGFLHILAGVDHLLFLLCLAIPARSVRALIPAVTAFTVAHSITLISSALALTPTALWFGPLVETLIAASVFYMACENMLGKHSPARWFVVFAFGLVHGFGFSFILADRMQFAGEHLIAALLAFNVGVELGQLLALAALAPLLALFFKYLPSEKIGVILLSALAAHAAWHWSMERGAQLVQFAWVWPAFDAAFFAAALRWLMLLMASGAALWGLNAAFKRVVPRS